MHAMASGIRHRWKLMVGAGQFCGGEENFPFSLNIGATSLKPSVCAQVLYRKNRFSHLSLSVERHLLLHCTSAKSSPSRNTQHPPISARRDIHRRENILIGHKLTPRQGKKKKDAFGHLRCRPISRNP